MLFSIVVPVYNVAEHLNDCLRSIDAQACNDYEVILVDDGSTDVSGTICDGYTRAHADRAKCLHKRNGGLLAARRSGIEASQGEYIISLDGDDCLKGDALEILKCSIKENDFPDVVLYGISRSEYFDTDFNPLPWDDGTLFSGANRSAVLSLLCSTYSLNSMCSKAIRRDKICLEYDFARFGRLNFGEDLLQVIPVLDKADTILFLKKNLYFYRVNPNSISKSFDAGQFGEIATVRNELLSFARKWDIVLPGNYFQSKVRGLNIQAAAECMQRACQTLSRNEWKAEVNRITESPFFIDAMQDQNAYAIPRFDYLFLARLAYSKKLGFVRAVSLVKKMMR